MRKALATASLAATVLAFSTPYAVAEDNSNGAVCKKRNELIQMLGKRFGETQRSFGLQSDSRVLEVYASNNGSWTAILTMPSGRSCVIAAGEAWTQLPPIPIGEPA